MLLDHVQYTMIETKTIRQTAAVEQYSKTLLRLSIVIYLKCNDVIKIRETQLQQV